MHKSDKIIQELVLGYVGFMKNERDVPEKKTIKTSVFQWKTLVFDNGENAQNTGL